MKNKKICIVCGKQFDCPPSSKKITCSADCSKTYHSRLRYGKKHDEATKNKIRKAATAKGVTDNLKKGTPAAQKSPKAGRFDTNSSAKEWTLIAPEGTEYKCVNLRNWIRENICLFDMDYSEENVDRIHAGLRTIKNHMKCGKRGITYHGWMIKSWSEKKNCEIEEDKT